MSNVVSSSSNVVDDHILSNANAFASYDLHNSWHLSNIVLEVWTQNLNLAHVLQGSLRRDY